MDIALPRWNIKKEHLDMVILYIKKIEELKNTQFFIHYQRKVEMSISHDNVNGITKISFDELNEEYIRSFFITFRVFTMSEPCSLKNLNKILFDAENGEFYELFKEEAYWFKQYRDAFNKYYHDDPPDIQLKVQKGNLSIEFHNREEIIETYAYGWPIHLNKPGKLAYYNAIHLNNDEGFSIETKIIFRMQLTTALIQLSKFLIQIQAILNHILEKILLLNQAWAELYFELEDFEKSRQFYHNCFYIENYLERKLNRAAYCKRLSEIYRFTGDMSQSKGFLSKYGDIMNAVCPFPPNFWDYEYYREYYKPAGEFAILIEKVKSFINFNNIPIIVLPIERNFELVRFFEFTQVKIVNYNEKTRQMKLHIPMGINQTVKNHHGLESKQASTWEIKDILIGEKYCLEFPFILHMAGYLALSNSPQDVIKSFFVWFGRRMLFEKELAFHTGFLLEFIRILCKIEKNITPTLEDYASIADLPSKTTMKITISEPHMDNPNQNYLMASTDIVRIHMDYFRRILDLICRILALPQLKEILDFKEDINVLKTSAIEKYLENPIEGNPFILYTLHVVLYSMLSGDKSYLIKYKQPIVQNTYEYFSKGALSAPSKDLLLGFYQIIEHYILLWKN